MEVENEMVTLPRRELRRLETRYDTPIVCGENPHLPIEKVKGCGLEIGSVDDLYRCFDCSIPFHQQCVKAHCAAEVKND